jgi:hypothetical protein
MNKSGPSSGFPGQSVTLRFDDAETFQGVVGYVCQGGNYMPYGGYTWEGNADHFTVNINLPCDDVSQQIKLSINGEDFYVDITRPHSAAAFTKLSDDIISGRRVQQWKVLCYCLDGNTANFTLDYTPGRELFVGLAGHFLGRIMNSKLVARLTPLTSDIWGWCALVALARVKFRYHSVLLA